MALVLIVLIQTCSSTNVPLHEIPAVDMINIPVFTGFIYARWLGMGYLNHQPYEKKTTSPKKGVERMDLH